MALIGTLLPIGRQQWFDDNGDPLAGGLLYTYAAGTSTPLATYSDQALTIANANPVVLDAGGRATVYGQSLAYKLVLQTALGALVWSQDQVIGWSPSSVSDVGTLTTTVTGTQTAFPLPAGRGSLRIFANNASLLTLQGIAAGLDGQELTLFAIGAGAIDVAHQNTGASAANRIITPTATTVDVQPISGRAYFIYDATTARWRLFPSDFPITTTITTTGTQTALPIPSGSGALTILANNASLLTIQGIAAGLDGQRLRICSIGAGQVDLAHQNGSASAANRLINFATSGATSLAAGAGVAEFVYDSSAARWRLTSHTQGAYITPTFAAGNYTSSGTWTVGSGDVVTQAYYLSGRSLTVQYFLNTTTVSGTPAALVIGNGAFGGFTIAKVATMFGFASNAGGPGEITYMQLAAGGTSIPINQVDNGTWTNATDTTYVYGVITFEVQ